MSEKTQEEIQKTLEEIHSANRRQLEIIRENEQRIHKIEKITGHVPRQRTVDTVQPPPTDE